MNKIVTKLLLIAAGLCLVFLPLAGSLIKWGDFPPGYGLFLTQKVAEPPGFDLTYFLVLGSICLLVLFFFLFPRVFGYKGKKEAPAAPLQKKFPWWFWASVPVLIVSWFFHWAEVVQTSSLAHFTFVPLWWSFIFLLDGWVYYRTGGRSLVASRSNTMKILAVVSCFTWFLFEYLNYFVLENWYYPNGDIFSNFGNIFWFSLSYNTVLPAVFEWYSLLKTFPTMRNRYSNGPKIRLGTPFKFFLLIAGLALAFLMGIYPYELFWGLWMLPAVLLTPAMGLLRLKTPFSSISSGNLTPVALMAIATFLNGVFWELWNFGSGWFGKTVLTNPNYWKYSVPYLDVGHFFSEMPIMGYFGYLAFGLVCWVLWLLAAYVFDFSPDIELPE